MKRLTTDDLEMMNYIDGLILTRDNHKLNETIKSIYYTLILDSFEPEDVERYLQVKLNYLSQTNEYHKEWEQLQNDEKVGLNQK